MLIKSEPNNMRVNVDHMIIDAKLQTWIMRNIHYEKQRL